MYPGMNPVSRHASASVYRNRDSSNQGSNNNGEISSGKTSASAISSFTELPIPCPLTGGKMQAGASITFPGQQEGAATGSPVDQPGNPSPSIPRAVRDTFHILPQDTATDGAPAADKGAEARLAGQVPMPNCTMIVLYCESGGGQRVARSLARSMLKDGKKFTVQDFRAAVDDSHPEIELRLGIIATTTMQISNDILVENDYPVVLHTDSSGGVFGVLNWDGSVTRRSAGMNPISRQDSVSVYRNRHSSNQDSNNNGSITSDKTSASARNSFTELPIPCPLTGGKIQAVASVTSPGQQGEAVAGPSVDQPSNPSPGIPRANSFTKLPIPCPLTGGKMQAGASVTVPGQQEGAVTGSSVDQPSNPSPSIPRAVRDTFHILPQDTATDGAPAADKGAEARLAGQVPMPNCTMIVLYCESGGGQRVARSLARSMLKDGKKFTVQDFRAAVDDSHPEIELRLGIIATTTMQISNDILVENDYPVVLHTDSSGGVFGVLNWDGSVTRRSEPDSNGTAASS